MEKRYELYQRLKSAREAYDTECKRHDCFPSNENWEALCKATAVYNAQYSVYAAENRKIVANFLETAHP